MSYTYSGNPLASPVDETHFRLGNTNPADPIATDEECALALRDNGGNTYLAAAAVAETKILTFALRPIEIRHGDRVTRWPDAAAYLKALAATLRSQASLHTGMPIVYAGGIDRGDKLANELDQSLVEPFAAKHLHEPWDHHRGGHRSDLSRSDW